MSFIKKYNIYIFIAIAAGFVMVNVAFWTRLSLVRQLVTVFAVFAALHEIEEKIWPGGFFELMLKKLGMKPSEVDLGRGTLIVSVYWLLLLGSAYLFDSHPFLLAATIVLSFFEAIVHTAGIKLHHLKKPYTPGMVTALGLAAVGIASVYQLNAGGMLTGAGYLLGGVLWFLSFVGMDLLILSGLGKTIPELVRGIKEKS